MRKIYLEYTCEVHRCRRRRALRLAPFHNLTISHQRDQNTRQTQLVSFRCVGDEYIFDKIYAANIFDLCISRCC